ncbi:TlpA family protein disulfide reductase [Mucilaginibacter terrae]|uniref:Thiol-disulfide isomerase/thioredoxin n=1 Tax=Mucilaginibacter terrae TaxID=1955052 RepID=A0ABU3GND0_9SPHI|nr:TlpA disulfide reductase family protein [Mucilaginibacter terrae]MDT3401051.1 thiol-disulfide isomerase/thioredoxin [Mucilaginibacter terrae]
MNLYKLLLIIFYSCLCNYLFAKQTENGSDEKQITYLTGKINSDVQADTLTLVLHGPFFSYQTDPEKYSPQTLTTIPNKNGEFKFKIVAGTSPFHISLFLSSKRNGQLGLINEAEISNYLIEPGDSINVVFAGHKQVYTGKGKTIFEAQYTLQQSDIDERLLKADKPYSFVREPLRWLSQKDSLMNIQLTVLEKFRPSLSDITFSVLRADLIGSNRAFVYSRISYSKPFFSSGTILDKNLDSLCRMLVLRPDYISINDRSILAPKYVDYLYKKLQIEVKYGRLKNDSDVRAGHNYFDAIKNQFTGVLRDKLLAWWLLELASINDLQPQYLANAMELMQTPVFIKIAEELKATFTKGQLVEDYGFTDAKGKIVHLSDFKGRVIVIDLWFSGCTGCVRVAENMPLVEKVFEKRKDVVFLSISIDRDKNKWLKSISKEHEGQDYTHYTTPSTVYIYTGGTAGKNSFIKKYVPGNSYPSILLVDKKRRMFSATPPTPVSAQARSGLIDLIEKALNFN